ncbi:calpain-5-like [Ylistrum balloti]|uniref:calpain-5-like n=1 Tax=Ylistrum balloti TaxID=509963 RepID=UPI002905B417|nr:calpain-5-like [Ylistrum balloti]
MGILGLFDSAIPYKGQKYKDLKKSCVSTGTLFTDEEFPPKDSSLSYDSNKIPHNVQWRRPGEICSDPKFFMDGASANDFAQGEIGNCWFVAACACIAENASLWKKIVPDFEGQEWIAEKNQYAGIFHFRFWRCGEWIDVVIDDYLPTRNGKLIYCHSPVKNEFWPALLEKAYAKLFGDYQSLVAGLTRDALVDMSGGVGEQLDITDYKTEEEKMELFRILKQSYKNQSLMSASIAASGDDMEDELDCGLIKGHAYSVTSVKDIPISTSSGLFSFFKREKIHMIRCRNPWGGTEWKGAWSDGSAEWDQVSDSMKKDIGLTVDDNGEFWMSFEDFCNYYTDIGVCHIINTSFFSLKKTWKEGETVGEWRKPSRSGGCSNHKKSFLKNPQFVFEVTKEEDEVLVSLEQFDRRVNKEDGESQFTIGVSILKTDLNRVYRMHDSMREAHSSSFVKSRSVMTRAKLKQGKYCVIPSTFDPGFEGEFFLRLYASSSPNLKELTLEEPDRNSGCCCSPFYMCKTYKSALQILISSGEGLEGMDLDRKSDPFVIVRCEKEKVKTPVIANDLNPKFDERVTFYQKTPKENVTLEVWNHNLIKDDFMGMCTLSMTQRSSFKGGSKLIGLPLMGKGKEAARPTKGRLWVNVLYTTLLDTV